VSGQHKDGSIFLLEVASSEIVLDGRRYFMVIVGNTATRAQLTKQSREAEVRLSEFARIAHVGGWFWDMGERVVLTEETYRIYGVNQADFVPTLSSVVALIHPDDQPYVGKWITDAVAGVYVREINYRMIRPDGAIRYVAGRQCIDGQLDRLVIC